MKKHSMFFLAALFVLSFLPRISNAQWANVGSPGFSGAQAQYMTMAFDSHDTAYAAYYDASNGNKATVVKYNGSNWVPVGGGAISSGISSYTSIAIDSQDNIYVAYRDAANSNRATVMKYDGSSWVTIGTTTLPGNAAFIYLTMDNHDTLSMAYSDNSSGVASLMKYDGSNWVTVGGGPYSQGGGYYSIVAFDSNNDPYIAYRNYNPGGNIFGNLTVRKFSNGSWSNVGNAGFSSNGVTIVGIAIGINDTPFVAYSDQSLTSRITVMKYNGSGWVSAGGAPVSGNYSAYSSLAADSAKNIYVAYNDGSDGNRISTKKYKNGSWQTVGSSGFSPTSCDHVRLVLNSKAEPYVIYRDGNASYFVSVMGYTSPNTWNGTTWSLGTPDSTHYVGISSNVAPATFSCNDIIIESGMSLNTDTSNTVTIYGDLINNGNGLTGTGTLIFTKNGTSTLNGDTIAHEGTILVEAGCTLATANKLRLLSNDTATGRIGESAGTITGNVMAQRYQPGKRCFRFYAHPFTTSIALSQLTDDIDITGSGGATNGFTTSQTNAPSAFWFDVSAADTSTTGANPGWTAFTHTNGTGANSWDRYELLRLLVRGDKGQGLSGGSYTPNASTFEAAGAVNQGTQVITLTKGTNSTFVGCGNPFPSGVQMQNVAVGGNVGANYYAWDATSGAAGAYVTNAWTLPYVLPAYAAFFTTVSATDNITIEEADKETGGAGLFKGTSSANWVELVISDSSTKWDRLLINLDDNAMDVEDKLDGKKLYNPGLDFFTLSKDSTRLAVDVRPYTDSNSIPLGLTAYTRYNKYVIRTGMFDIPAGTKLYLHDKYLNKQEELKAGFEYWFDVTTDSLSQGNQRFEINMVGKPSNSITGAEKQSAKMQLIPNPARDEVKVSFDKLAGKTLIRLMTVTGQVVYSQTVQATTGSVTIPLHQVLSGIYIVDLQSTNARFTEKLIKE